MGTQAEDLLDSELLRKLKTVLGQAIAELNAANGTDIQLDQFAAALDTESRTVHRLLAAVVKETMAPRRPSTPTSPSTSMRGSSMHGSLHGGYSPAIDAAGSWVGTSRRGRLPSAGVDLDHVRSLMEAIEIVSPHMVGADLGGCGSPIPDSRSGWQLPSQAAHSLSEQHALPVGSLGAGDAHSHAVRNRRLAAQAAHAAGIPIRPSRPRGRGGHIDPIEFAEYAVAHMRPSPRFTPMGHGSSLGTSMASEPRSSLPRSFRAAHFAQQTPDVARQPPMHLPRQHALDAMRLASSSAHSARADLSQWNEEPSLDRGERPSNSPNPH